MTQTAPLSFQDLPLILAGPLLQHTEPTAVTIWVALKQPQGVALTVLATDDQGHTLGQPVAHGFRTTVALGQCLHVVAVTAHLANGKRLSSDRIYAYDLTFQAPADDALQPDRHRSISLETALVSRAVPEVTISYFAHKKPTFALPPDNISDLRLVHGSCRKPHGDGFDALTVLDCLIENTAHLPRERPHQLFLTGDQIYGDDVANPLLWVATRLGDALLGWEEQLPFGAREADIKPLTPRELPAGRRSEIATKAAGFTAGLREKRAKVTSHMLSLGEYYACYLLAWSPVCWPAHLPQGRDISRDRKEIKTWDQEAKDIRQFIYTLWKVRRAMANIPMYTIFDDHDVSDDWNLNQAWCLRVLGKPLGRRAVQNALLAYAVFQAWGNTPGQFESGQLGEKLLYAAQAWSASQGTDRDAFEAIARYVGMPALDPHTELPRFDQDGSTLILNRHPETLTWGFTVHSASHDVIVLDTRTWRGYPADEKPIAPPTLLSPKAFKQQLGQLSDETTDPNHITFVVAPTNVFGLKVIDWIHQRQLRQNNVFSTDVGDAWNVNLTALAQLITTLFSQQRRVIVLSGDIHYSSVVKLSFTDNKHPEAEPKVMLQLTASAFKNEEAITRIIHTRLKDWLLPEKMRQWHGWNNPVDMVEVNGSAEQHPTPDWICGLEWLRHSGTRLVPNGNHLPWLMPPKTARAIQKWRWLWPFMFWQYPWLQDGREVVGVNNLALVHFEASPDGGLVVIQDLHWFAKRPPRLVYSRFASTLAPNQTALETD